MKKSLLPIALMAVLGITACANNGETEPQTDPAPTITGFKISNKDEIQKDWFLNDNGDATSTRNVRFSMTPAGAVNANQAIQKGWIVGESDNTAVVSVTGAALAAHAAGEATVTFKYDGGKFTDTLAIKVSPERESETTTIKAIRDNWGKVGGTTISPEDGPYYKYTFPGKITGAMEGVAGADVTAEINHGVYVQDGEYALALYNGYKKDNIEKAFKENGLKIGDVVTVTGYVVDAEKGGPQCIPLDIKKAEAGTTVADPTALTMTATTKQENLVGQEGRLVTIADAKVKEVSFKTPKDHGYVTFTIGEGTEEWSFSANHHTGETAMAALIEKCAGIPVGHTVDIKGIVSWYQGKRNITPVFLAENITPADCIVPDEIPAPTALTIKAEGDAKAIIEGDTLKLTVAATPATAGLAVDWTSSDDTIAKVDKFGVVTGVKPAEKVTITATSKLNAEVKATIDLQIKERPAPNGPSPIQWNQEGFYKLALVTSAKKTVFFKGVEPSGNPYWETTEDYKLGATIQIIKNGKVTVGETETDKINVKVGQKYLALGNFNTWKNGNALVLADKAYDWTYDATRNIITGKVGQNTYYVGTQGNYDTFSAPKISYFDDGKARPAQPYDYFVNPPKIEEVKAGEYMMGAYSAKKKEMRYIAEGDIDYGAYAWTNAATKSAKMILNAVEGKANTYTLGIDDTHYFATAAANSDKCKFVEKAAAAEFVYNADKNTLTTHAKNLDLALGIKNSDGYANIKYYDVNATDIAFMELYELPPVAPEALGVTISGTTSTVVGETAKLYANVYPATSTAAVTWESKTLDIATVDEEGIVTGVAAGEATIQVKVGETVTATQTVKVSNLPEKVYPTSETNKLYAAYDFRNNTKTTFADAITAGLDATVSEGATIAIEGVSKFYVDDLPRYIKLSSSKENGSLKITAGENITQVSVLCRKYRNDYSSIYLDAAEAEKVSLTSDLEWVTLNVATPALSTTLNAIKRVQILAIAVYVAK